MKFHHIFLCSLVILCSACAGNREQGVSQPRLLQIHDRHLIPEGIAVHPATGTIYISSIAGQKVVSIDKNGAVKDVLQTGAGGFMQGLGMKFSANGNLLWVCSSSNEGNTALFCIDARTNTILGRYTHDSARFFNDLVIGDDEIFITDSNRGEVFHFDMKTRKMSQWLRHQSLTFANGIAFSADRKVLLVASGRYGVQHVDLASRNIESISRGQHIDYGIDGMVCRGSQLYCVIGWPQDNPAAHRVVRYELSADSYFIRSDTLMIGRQLKAPTTAALRNGQLLVLNNTGLDIYNAHGQVLSKIRDSLAEPNIVSLKIRQGL
jgi:sugar lactone lactonase YvrE